MIGKYGKNLHVFILTKSNENWKPFGCWFSVRKYLPDASISLLIEQHRDFDLEWIKRLKINYKTYKSYDKEDELSNKLELLWKTPCDNPCLVLPSESFVTREIEIIKNTKINISSKDNEIWLVNKINFLNLLENYRLRKSTPSLEICEELSCDIKDNNISFITTYKKGCGKWINNMKDCPFTTKELLSDENTLNALKAVEIWTDAADLYNHVI